MTLPLLLTGIVYWRIVRVYFWADDFMCLLKIVDWGFARFVLEPFAGHLLVLRNVVFYLTYQVFGLHAAAFFAIVLLTHLVNVWLLFRVVRALTASVWLAAFGATLWGTSPLNLGTLGWYSVYGQMLLTTIVLAVLGQIARHRVDGPAPSRGLVAGWCGLILVGTTCFGMGLAIALVFPAVLFLLLPATFRDRALRWRLLAFPAVVPVFWVALRWLYAVCFAPLSPQEEFTTQAAFAAPWAIPGMFWHLTLYAVSGTLVGFVRPLGYPSALAAALAGTYFVALAATTLSADAITRRRLAALVLVCLAVYAAVATGRAHLDQMFGMPPATAAQQLRYHYLAPALVSSTLCLVLARLARWRWLRLVGMLCLGAWLGMSTWGYARSGWRIDERSQARAYVRYTLATIDTLVDKRPVGSEVRIPSLTAMPPQVIGWSLDAHSFPGWAGVYAITIPGNVLRGRRIRFVERDRELVSYFRAAADRRMAGLLVMPGEQRP